MFRPKTDDSGVHETGRALDISIHQYDPTGSRVVSTMSSYEIKDLVSWLNAKYKRNDPFLTAKAHDAGSGLHIHLQVPV
mgnify:FL=1